MTICTCVDRHVSESLGGEFNDIEDAMQYACAKGYDCDVFIGRGGAVFVKQLIFYAAVPSTSVPASKLAPITAASTCNFTASLSGE